MAAVLTRATFPSCLIRFSRRNSLAGGWGCPPQPAFCVRTVAGSKCKHASGKAQRSACTSRPTRNGRESDRWRGSS
jgi:hypothetical protein